MSHHDPDAGTLAPLTPAEERLERYLDGVMSDAERAAFEAETAGDAAVQEQIAAHRRLTSVLGAMYETKPVAAAAAAPDLKLAGSSKPNPRRLLRVAGVAAAAAIAIGAGIYFFTPRPQASSPVVATSEDFQNRNRKYMLDEYKRQVASGFKPAEVCTTDEQFQKWTARAFGAGLKPTHNQPGSNAPAEPVLAGWSRATIFSGYSGLLLAHVDGKPVMVVMDKAIDRMVPKDDAATSPRLFRRKIGEMWLIEVTPLDTPRVINMIESAPVAPPAP